MTPATDAGSVHLFDALSPLFHPAGMAGYETDTEVKGSKPLGFGAHQQQASGDGLEVVPGLVQVAHEVVVHVLVHQLEGPLGQACAVGRPDGQPQVPA